MQSIYHLPFNEQTIFQEALEDMHNLTDMLDVFSYGMWENEDVVHVNEDRLWDNMTNNVIYEVLEH